MPKYLIEMDDLHGDCSYCPMFHREGNEEAECVGAKKDMRSIPEQSMDKRFDVIEAFPIPDWCPLERVSDDFVEFYELHQALSKMNDDQLNEVIEAAKNGQPFFVANPVEPSFSSQTGV